MRLAFAVAAHLETGNPGRRRGARGRRRAVPEEVPRQDGRHCPPRPHRAVRQPQHGSDPAAVHARPADGPGPPGAERRDRRDRRHAIGPPSSRWSKWAASTPAAGAAPGGRGSRDIRLVDDRGAAVRGLPPENDLVFEIDLQLSNASSSGASLRGLVVELVRAVGSGTAVALDHERRRRGAGAAIGAVVHDDRAPVRVRRSSPVAIG